MSQGLFGEWLSQAQPERRHSTKKPRKRSEQGLGLKFPPPRMARPGQSTHPDQDQALATMSQGLFGE